MTEKPSPRPFMRSTWPVLTGLALGLACTAPFGQGNEVSLSPDDDTTLPDDDTTPDEVHLSDEVYGVVLVVIDTLRADLLPCGSSAGTMPFAESIMGEGACFPLAFSTSSWTTPGTVSLLSGLHVDTHGMLEPNVHVPEQIRILPDMTRIYDFFSVQKSANNLASDGGIELRFDAEYNENNKDGYMPSDLDAVVVTDVETALFEHDLGGTHPRFALHIQMASPHTPYCPPGSTGTVFETDSGSVDFCDEGDRQAIVRAAEAGDEAIIQAAREFYRQEAAYADAQLEELWTRFEDHGLLDRTLFIVTSDHGEAFGEHDCWGHDQGVPVHQTQVPLLVWGPGVPKGVVVPGLVSGVDVLPTALDYLGIPVGPNLEGRSLRPLIEAPTPTPPYRAFMRDLLPGHDAVADGVIATSVDGTLWAMLRSEGEEDRVYHFEVDPQQTTDLAGTPEAKEAEALLGDMLLDKPLAWEDWLAWFKGKSP